MLVKAYKDRKSIRVTVPKQFYEQFAEISEKLGAGKVPCLRKRTVIVTRYTQNEYEPYFSNCDFGLALYVGDSTLKYMTDIRQYGKTSLGVNISRIGSSYLDLLAGSTLECEILENARPEPGYYQDKIIGYKIIRQESQT